MYQQAIEEYFQALLSENQCGFIIGYSVINALLPMIEKWKKIPGRKWCIWSSVNLSKVFDCLPPELLIVKLHAYGVDIPSIKLLHSYLTKRKERVKLNGTYSSWSEILVWNSQFNSDVDIANCTDDNIPHLSNINLSKVLHDLEKISNTLFKSFTDNLQKANPEKHIFLRTQHKKFKLTLMKLPSPTVNVKRFWVSILIINWHLSPL